MGTIENVIKEYQALTGENAAASRRAIKNVLTALEEVIVKEGGARIIGHFTFELKERPEREGHNPKTGEKMTIPAHKALVVRPSAELKKRFNG